MKRQLGLLHPGRDFTTTLTRRAGTVLSDRSHNGVNVAIEKTAGTGDYENRVLHPGVWVEVEAAERNPLDSLGDRAYRVS